MSDGHEDPAADARALLPRPDEPLEQYAERLRGLHRDVTLVLRAVERGLAAADGHGPRAPGTVAGAAGGEPFRAQRRAQGAAGPGADPAARGAAGPGADPAARGAAGLGGHRAVGEGAPPYGERAGRSDRAPAGPSPPQVGGRAERRPAGDAIVGGRPRVEIVEDADDGEEEAPPIEIRPATLGRTPPDPDAHDARERRRVVDGGPAATSPRVEVATPPEGVQPPPGRTPLTAPPPAPAGPGSAPHPGPLAAPQLVPPQAPRRGPSPLVVAALAAGWAAALALLLVLVLT